MQASLTYLGHATVLLDLAGGRILTDPVLRARVGYLRRIPAVPRWDAPVSLVLISHVHHDHLDGPSLRRFPTSTPVVAPAGDVDRHPGRPAAHPLQPAGQEGARAGAP
jgi:L-ascorbate metabolism protein UlaG (beta-lactamase superfamily)